MTEIKKFTIPCDFNGKKVPVSFYIGQPDGDHHPIQFQAKWLSEERGGTVLASILENLEKLHEISKRNKVSFAELCEYALTAALQPTAADTKTLDGTEPKTPDSPAPK